MVVAGKWTVGDGGGGEMGCGDCEDDECELNSGHC